MKKYEYKFVPGTSVPLRMVFPARKKVQYLEEKWNALGAEGWEFLRDGYNCLIFRRVREED